MESLALRISQNWALELANASSRAKDTRIKHCRRTGLPLISAWVPEASGMRQRTASHCVFRQIGHSNWRMRVAGPKTPALSTVAGQFYPSLVLYDLSRVGYGARQPRIAYFAKLGPRIGECE